MAYHIEFAERAARDLEALYVASPVHHFSGFTLSFQLANFRFS
jgi:hypothetical protein